MKTVLCDINVFLDICLKREPDYQASAELFSMVEERKIRGLISAASFPIMFYLLCKSLSEKKALRVLEKIRTVFRVAPVNDRVIDLAMVSELRDFEDAVQYYSAVLAKADCIITRNKRDFRKSSIPVLLPEEFLVQENNM